MAYSRDSYTGDGSTTDWTVTFPYLQKSHVKVYLDGSLTSAWSWVNSSKIRFDSAPGNGVSILIKRQTSPATRLVDYQTPSSLNEEDLDRDSLQAFYLQQESLDEVATVLAENLSGQYDAESKRIINVADPTSDQDAATKGWVDSTYEDAVTEAENWATYAEDSPVPEGNGSEYSAYHHAQKADDSATAAATSESNAATSESNASTSESNAATSETNAAASESKAQLWAEEEEDVEVETGEYSAYHWAQKAAENSGGSASSITYDNSTSGLTATDVQAALDEIDGNFDGHAHTLADISDSGALAGKSSIATGDIDNNAVTYGKMQDISTGARVLGRASGAGAGDPTELSDADLRSILSDFGSNSNGLVPDPGGSSGRFLKDDGTWDTTGSSVDDKAVAKAWVQFNGKNTLSVNDSFNVSSVNDDGTGEYTINFSTNFANSDYAVTGFIERNSGESFPLVLTAEDNNSKTTSSMEIDVFKTDGSGRADSDRIGVAFFGVQ